MKKKWQTYFRVCPIIGIGAHIDYYNKKQHGFDAEQRTIIFPFLIIRVVILYELQLNDKPSQVSV